MRIKESQLRIIVRNLVKEAPLADFYPVIDAPTGAVGIYDPKPADAVVDKSSFASRVGGPGSLEKLKRTYSHPNFSSRLKKLLQSFPIEVYVLPIALDESGMSLGIGRLNIFDKKDIFEESPESNYGNPADKVIRKGDAVSFMKKWAAESPAGSCLVCPVSYSIGNANQGVTPWTIFHSFFDSDDEGSTDYRILRQCPSIEQLQNNISKVGSVLMDEEEFYGERIRNKKEPMKMISKIFTFGSARANYLSRYQGGEFVDLQNESSVQACLTTKGFTYNSDAVEELPISEESKEQIYSLLDEAVSLSSACKTEFANFLKDKIVIVANLPE